QATTELIIQYDFTQADCRDGLIKDTVGAGEFFGDLVLNTSSSSCIGGVGIEGNADYPGWPAAHSVGDTTALRGALQEPDTYPGFSLELWLNIADITSCPEDTSSCLTPILTINYPSIIEGTESCIDTVNIQLGYRISTNTLFISTPSQYGTFCNDHPTYTDVLPDETKGYSFHVVLTIEEFTISDRVYSYFTWYINGTRADYNLDQDPAVTLGIWEDGHNLQLLDYTRWADSTRWFKPTGAKIYRVAMHNETLDTATVLSRYTAGITNSTVSVYSSTVYIAEDGEAGNHYGEPESYLEVFPESELRQIVLDVYDSDTDVASPNLYVDSNPRVFVDTLPFTGFLVDSTGGNIISTPLEVFPTSGEYAVRYRPLFNDFSTANDTAYANFSFHAIDIVSGNRSYTNATVHIYVYAKNDPPAAGNASYEVNVGTRQNIIPLNGTDIDADDYIQTAGIVETPAKGSLFQVR
ncbi:unnamed protein product, partial [Laminaria digitata]